MTTTTYDFSTIVTFYGFDSCVKLVSGGVLICKVRANQSHSDFKLTANEVLVDGWQAGLESVHKLSVKPLTVRDVKTYYSKSDYKTIKDALSRCVPV